MNTFTLAYLTAALWSSLDDDCQPLDSNYNPSDIAPATLTRMEADCERFQKENASLLEAAYADGSLPVNGSGERKGGEASAGHDFWFTRNADGTGFWDGDWDSVENGGAEYGARLSAAAKAFGTFDLYIGDDGQIHGSPL